MKKLSVIALAVAATMLFAIPAMAVDVNFSGSYTARGFFNDNRDLNDDAGATDAFMDMRFRLKTVFKVHDNLSVTTRFDALDRKAWGTSDSPADSHSENIDWDRAYLTAKFDVFDLYVGRMSAAAYGTKFLDSVTEADRIKLIKKLDPWTLMAIYQKTSEQDVYAISPSASDQDSDAYMASVQYRAEGMDAGLLVVYTNDKTVKLGDINPDGSPTAADYVAKYWTLNPYIRADVGPIKLEGELGWKTGDYQQYSLDTNEDVDYDAQAYHLNAAMDVGPTKLSLGYAFSSGDVTDDKDYEAYPLANDWSPLLILFGRAGSKPGDDIFKLGSETGYQGNFNKQEGVGNYGYQVFYGTLAFSPIENVTLNAIIGTANADETPTGVDDDVGTEYDVGVTVKLMDNLVYKAILGYLDAGDFWKGAGTTDVDDTYMLFHQLQVKF